MKCSKCMNYSRSLMRCTQGKINPLKVSIKNGVETAQIMGLDYFCRVDQECLDRVIKIRAAIK